MLLDGGPERPVGRELSRRAGGRRVGHRAGDSGYKVDYSVVTLTWSDLKPFKFVLVWYRNQLKIFFAMWKLLGSFCSRKEL